MIISYDFRADGNLDRDLSFLQEILFLLESNTTLPDFLEEIKSLIKKYTIYEISRKI